MSVLLRFRLVPPAFLEFSPLDSPTSLVIIRDLELITVDFLRTAVFPVEPCFEAPVDAWTGDSFDAQLDKAALVKSDRLDVCNDALDFSDDFAPLLFVGLGVLGISSELSLSVRMEYEDITDTLEMLSASVSSSMRKSTT